MAEQTFFSLAPDQDLAEQLGLMESFLTEKGAGLFQIQVVHLWYCSWENIAIKFIFQKIHVLQIVPGQLSLLF